MTKTVVTVNLEQNEELRVSKKKYNRKWLFPFQGMGKLSVKNIDTLDSLEIISHFTKGELTLLREVKNNIDHYHRVTLEHSSRSLSTAIRQWLSKGLIKRIRREHYMVSPYFFTPAIDLHEKMLEHWEKL